MQWIDVKERLPQLSYVESDNVDDDYECCPVLVFSHQRPGIICVAYLVQEQDEDSWDFGKLSWELYIPGNGGDIIERDLSEFTHWMPLPPTPDEQKPQSVCF